MKIACCIPLLTATLLASTGRAQWSADAAFNLSIADDAESEVQPKLAATLDGGFYVSWFDSDADGTPAFGFDVYLQRLDSAGDEQWAHNGILVADRGFSSTQDYDLDVDANGNALLTFRDDRFGGVQVTAAKVDPSGALVWGPNGVQLTSTTDFIAAPKIAGTTDGNAVVAWAQAGVVHVQKLDGSGLPLWASDVELTPPSGSLTASDLNDSDAGGVIIALTLDPSTFGAPRSLLAQKFDTDGNALWGATPVAVLDSGSLQFGNFPSFVSDQNGGAVFGWYTNSPSLECYAQRLDAGGSELFAHNGVAASTDLALDRVSPSFAFDPATNEVFLFYTEQTLTQDRVGAQKFDANGARLWTPTGLAVTPLAGTSITGVQGVATGDGATVFWADTPSFGNGQIDGTRIDAAGSVSAGPFSVSSTAASKSRLFARRSSLGFATLVFQDDASGSEDVQVQNALPYGELGGLASTGVRNGSGANPLCYSSQSEPAIGTSWITDVNHLGASTFTATQGYSLPSAGLILPGIGEVLVDLAGAPVYVTTVFSTGLTDTHSIAIPPSLTLVGVTVATQALIVNGLDVELCNAIDAMIGL